MGMRFAVAVLLIGVVACAPQPASPAPAPVAPGAPAGQKPAAPAAPAAAPSLKPAAAPGAPPAIPSSERELVAAIRGGTFEETFVKHIFPSFERKHNVKVTHTVDTSVAALAKIQAQRSNPQTDVIINTDQTHPQAKERGLVEKLDPARVPNLKNLIPPALDPDGVGVIYGIFNVGIQYNTDIYKEKGIPAPSSWNDLLDPRVRGHMAINSVDNTYGMALLIGLARANGADERNVEPAFAKLKTLGKDLLIAKAPANLDEFFQQKVAWVASNGWV